VAAPEPAPVVVTRDNARYPPRCRPRAAAMSIQRFLTLQSVSYVDFEHPPEGGGFYADSVRPGAGVTATNAGQLARWFEARHAKGERLQLVELLIDYDGGRRLGHLDYKVRRRADDVKRGGGAWNTEGKGAIRCADGKIVAWAMSTVPARARTGRVCPGRPRARAVVACT
jgi:hypothetical protein